jgi:DNA-binding NarL/FixJ family response regulator
VSAALSVIIADDHPLFRKGLRQAIEEDSTMNIVGEAADGGTALRLIEEKRPDVAVLDIDMPGMSGLQIAKAIQQQNLLVAVVILTIYRQEDMFNEAMDVGAWGYVLKESAADDILDAIHTVADGRYYISPRLSDHLIKRSTRVGKLLSYTPSLEDLTPAELRILRLIAEGKTSKDIAGLLSISYKTVENHRTNIASKLKLRGSHSLLKFAMQNKDAMRRA